MGLAKSRNLSRTQNLTRDFDVTLLSGRYKAINIKKRVKKKITWSEINEIDHYFSSLWTLFVISKFWKSHKEGI